MRRLTARLAIVVVIAAVAAGVLAAWASSRGAAPAFDRTAGASGGQHGAARPAPVLPAPSSAAHAPYKIQVTGAPAGVKAKGAELIDAATGQVLWNKNMNTPLPMASITKVMTALVVLQAGDMNRPITVPKAVIGYVAKYGAESAGLLPGEVLTSQELLEVLLVTSAADAAYSLATSYGPGLPAFIVKMNAEAKELGMEDTWFTSPDGLPYPTETSTYSTPADLITLGLAAMKYPLFRSIVGQPSYQLRGGPGRRAEQFANTNPLIGHYKGALGIKTGYTPVAGHTLLFEAARNGRDLLGVVLGSPATGPASAAQDAEKMLNWAFALPAS